MEHDVIMSSLITIISTYICWVSGNDLPTGKINLDLATRAIRGALENRAGFEKEQNPPHLGVVQ